MMMYNLDDMDMRCKTLHYTCDNNNTAHMLVVLGSTVDNPYFTNQHNTPKK